MTPREVAEQTFRRAIVSLDPRAQCARALADAGPPGGRGGEVVLLGVGKAAVAMAAGVRDVVRVADDAVVIGPADASHPRPDARSEAAARRLLARAAAVRDDQQIVFVLSGGASSLAALPAPGIRLAEKLAVTDEVMARGADIRALNVVRKHLSAIKGGRLAQATRARITALVLSDVVGDDLATIGGAPVTADPSTCDDAHAVIGHPIALPLSETPKLIHNVDAHIIAGPDDLLRAAETALADLGVRVVHREPRVTDDVDALADRLVARAKHLATSVGRGELVAAIAVGEPTIRLAPHPGRGGRAQHVALRCALGIRDLTGIDLAILAAGSDGRDGPTDDAGGIVDARTATRASAAGADAEAALRDFDAGRALAAAGDLFTPGPTGTNLCDLFLIVWGRS